MILDLVVEIESSMIRDFCSIGGARVSPRMFARGVLV